MINSKPYLLAISISLLALSLPACKAKKAIVAPAAPVEVKKEEPAPVPKPAPPVEVKKEVPPPPAKPDYNFSNIQFEFNSPILKTSSYPTLDHIAAEMKKDPSAKFILNGYSSSEGTDQHNMILSEERASSVKLYLTNTGVGDSNLTTKGNGESNPIADNTTEAGKSVNRRVEIKLVP
ncbi:MAG TPA: OmpA family protein [Mucilaginibacter sp.]